MFTSRPKFKIVGVNYDIDDGFSVLQLLVLLNLVQISVTQDCLQHSNPSY
jgi:hypothetical protein